MKRSTVRWTTAIAATALLAVPASGLAQAPSVSPQQSSERPAAAGAQQPGSAHEHVRKAAAALNDIPAASLTGVAKARVAELKRHVSTLEQAAAGGQGQPSAGAATQHGSDAWSTEVAAADTILTELLGGTATTGASESVGTAGTTATTPPRSETSTAATLDETTRAKLQEARTHITAFAAAMKGGSATPSADDPAAAASASGVSRGETAASSTPQPTGAASAASPESSRTAQTTTTPTPETGTTQGAEPGQTAGTTGAAGAQPPDAAQTGMAQPDPAVVKQHLSAARDSLSQLTQLPAASQLTGDARTQVSQLISNFNELITTNTEWRASFAKVQANLNTLLGDQRADESAAPTAGAAGAVGTAGAVTIDPAIRAKLVEFRTHLTEFEKAATGTLASTAGESSTAPAATSPAATSPAETPATSTTATTAAGAAETSTQTATTGTSGSTAERPAPAGTTGSAATADAATAQAGEKAAAGHSEALKHIDAIEAVLGGQTPATASSPDNTAAGSTLTAAQIAEIKAQLAELRKAISQSGR